MEPNFEIKKTYLSYNKKFVRDSKVEPIDGSNESSELVKNNIILEIPNLIINKDELAFVFGFSGSGKSTLLEALGLMNDTIVGKTDSVIKTGFDTSIDNLSKLWQSDLKKKLYSTRKEHLSFVFQNTILLPNFSIVENVMLPTLIGDDSPEHYYRSFLKAIVLLHELKLDTLEINKRPTQVSGGQRQRLAFARAFLPDFDVLFGDEPTGNLDESNAEHLFNFLKYNIKLQNKCAIIVSHSIDLTLKYADKIILLSKNTSEIGGCIIEESNIFLRDGGDFDKGDTPNDTVKQIIDLNSMGTVIKRIDEVMAEKILKTKVGDLVNDFSVEIPTIPSIGGVLNDSDATWRDHKGNTITVGKMREKLSKYLQS